jgi:hypothetical protein
MNKKEGVAPNSDPQVASASGVQTYQYDYRHKTFSINKHKPLPKIKWPKSEATVLVEWKENPATPARVKRVPIHELRTWTFYGDEINE